MPAVRYGCPIKGGGAHLSSLQITIGLEASNTDLVSPPDDASSIERHDAMYPAPHTGENRLEPRFQKLPRFQLHPGYAAAVGNAIGIDEGHEVDFCRPYGEIVP